MPVIFGPNNKKFQEAQGLLKSGGGFEIELIHDYFMKQYKKSDAYQSNISDIVSEIASKYQFDSIDVEQTLNSGYWYQPFVNDSEFIINYLLPFAFSSGHSPINSS